MAKEVISTKLVQDAKQIIETARENAVRSVDFCRVQMYWKLGKRIFEEEQHGKKRADYGAYIVKSLAEKLEAEYGSGFGIRQIERARQFFLLYPIASAVRTHSAGGGRHTKLHFFREQPPADRDRLLLSARWI